VGLQRRIAGRATILLAVAVTATGVLVGLAAANSGSAAHPPSLGTIGKNATWTTIFKDTNSGIEGLTGDNHGNVYVAERGIGSNPCPVWQIAVANGRTTQIGAVPGPCSPSGLAFGPDHRLYITGADTPASDQIDVLTPGNATTTATAFATGVPQANGVAFDKHGNLWASDGNNKQGIVYRVGPAGGAASEVFRVPPMANSIGVGRQNGGLQGTTPNTPTAQDIVSNGLAFTRDGQLVIADTARGALWKVRLDSHGRVASPTGCDQTYTADTLCLDDVFLESPFMEGADGIAIDSAGRVWVDANERQAIIVVDEHGTPTEFFRNPVDTTTGRRNNGPLETPTSPVFLGRTLCTTSSDGNRRDNFPNSGGEVTNTGKISCLDQKVDVPGLNLPVR
jgi:sugar lactone lactonase YvrE